MQIVQIATGEIRANAFLAFEDASKQAFVVDPGADFNKIMAHIDHYGIEEVTHILLTHGHWDHIGAVAALKEATGAKVCIHERDLKMLSSATASMAAFVGGTLVPCEADIVLKGGETIRAAGMDVQVLHTPGHSGGSVCYLCGDVMFSGDTLFYMYCGRTDFPGSDAVEYEHSLNTVLRGLQKDYQVYTGHGIKTTLFAEFRQNPFFSRTV